ncbi:hypothetical protein RUM43_004385 [Polyplax serrata]|uniref:Uncharacterized protein n=1 Tax=Polyplax serrata TaxID=468196 RepID=A0AAN8SAU0_POLSC
METHALTHARIHDYATISGTGGYGEGAAGGGGGGGGGEVGWDAALSKPEEEEKHGRARGGTAGAKQQWLADGGGHRGATG